MAVSHGPHRRTLGGVDAGDTVADEKSRRAADTSADAGTDRTANRTDPRSGSSAGASVPLNETDVFVVVEERFQQQ